VDQPRGMRGVDPVHRPDAAVPRFQPPYLDPGRCLEAAGGLRTKELEASPGLTPLKPDCEESQTEGQDEQARHDRRSGRDCRRNRRRLGSGRPGGGRVLRRLWHG
jgi:hypothetical protein